MERHKCKLCSRTFANGRALGGHMKAHLATLPLPPKPQQQPPSLSDTASFSSSSYSSSESEDEQEEEALLAAVEQRETEEKSLMANYGLRENPKKSFRVADPEFSFPATDTGGSVVVQDRESETESKNPTRRRSKRTRKSIVMSHVHNNNMEGQPNNNNNKKQHKLSFMESPEPAEPVSSVSNTSPEEDVAMCLMMLSRDRWTRKSVVVKEEDEEIKLMKKRVRGKHQCENCGKTFRSSGALGSHKSICFSGEADANDKVFECPFCSKVFGSGQALGGHKRSHLIPSSTSNAANHSNSARLNLKENLFIDLNLPAPPEEDDLSVVSDA